MPFSFHREVGPIWCFFRLVLKSNKNQFGHYSTRTRDPQRIPKIIFDDEDKLSIRSILSWIDSLTRKLRMFSFVACEFITSTNVSWIVILLVSLTAWLQIEYHLHDQSARTTFTERIIWNSMQFESELVLFENEIWTHLDVDLSNLIAMLYCIRDLYYNQCFYRGAAVGI